MENIFNQYPYQCRMDWGVRGVKEATERGDIIVVVDVMSFSSAITNALHYGVIVYPFPRVGNINEFSKLINAEVCILERTRARELGLPSLSATSFNNSHRDKRLVVSSINGATCVRAANENNFVFAGSFLNLSAITDTLNKLQKEKNINITIIASGERWSAKNDDPRDLRPCAEDYLCAGAILELLEGTKSTEAKVCISAYKGVKNEIKEILTDCSSGRELKSIDFPEDVNFVSQIDLLKEVPVLIKDESGYLYFKNYN